MWESRCLYPKGQIFQLRSRPRALLSSFQPGSSRAPWWLRLDERSYPKGTKVSDAQLAAVNLTGDPFHPEWNYTINPRAK